MSKVCFYIVAVLSIALVGCRTCTEQKTGKFALPQDALDNLGLTLEEVDLRVPGLKKDYDFIWLSDLHVISDDMTEVDDVQTIKNRIELFRNPRSGLASLETWKRLPDVLNQSGADAVWFGADICDFGSLSNIRTLKDGFAKISVPFIYIRADHDVCNAWLKEYHDAEVAKLHHEIDGDAALKIMEYDDIIVAGFERSTSNMTPEALEAFKTVYALGKPIILLSHVPLDSPIDSTLGEASRSHWGNQNLCWGKDCTYVPNQTTGEFLDMVFRPDSLVKAVFSGHLHFSWQGKLTENLTQQVFSPAVTGTLGIIHVHN